MTHKENNCSDCHGVDRRSFMKQAATVAAVGASAPLLFDGRVAHAAPTPQSAAETAVKRFYASLSDKQSKVICFDFDNPLRTRVNANWHVTKPEIGDDFYSDDQRAIIDEILKGVTSEDGYGRLKKQMDEDAGGLNFFSVAMFGNPEQGKFEWELTGRHLTLRADGNSVDKVAFGGPIVYGHGEEDAKQNLFYGQTKKVNEVFKALDGKQAEAALLASAPKENAVKLQGKQGKFPGLSVAEMSADQVELVESTLKYLLAPYRQEDVDEVLTILKASGGLESLNMAFYKQGDLDNDSMWDIWRIEGPSFVWHFRGAPHVHAYINIGHAG